MHYLSSFEATVQYKNQLEQSSCGYLEIKASNKYRAMRAKCLYMSDYSTNNKLLFNINDVKFLLNYLLFNCHAKTTITLK